MKIPISKPYFGEEEKELIQKPLETGWVVQGPYVKEFEDKFTAYTGAKFGIATTSCTTALHMALIAAGVEAGDEVIVPAFTWVSTANVVEMLMAKPVFADIDLKTFNIDPAEIERLITEKTKAIIPVSLFGLSADIDPVIEIAAKYSLKVIEDDACATGAFYKGLHAGTKVDMGCFSFHPRKAITTGEGGMVLTGDSDIDQLLRSLRDHGASASDFMRHHGPKSYLLPDFDIVGYNYRMTDFQGALGVAQMERLEVILRERQRQASVYDNAFNSISWLSTPVVPDGYEHGYQSYVCLFDPQTPSLGNITAMNKSRNEIMDHLEGLGIATRPGTQGVHLLGFYQNKYQLKPGDYPNAYFADQLTISLPLFMGLTEEEQAYVINALKKIKGI